MNYTLRLIIIFNYSHTSFTSRYFNMLILTLQFNIYSKVKISPDIFKNGYSSNHFYIV